MIQIYMGVATEDVEPKTGMLTIYIPEMIYDHKGDTNHEEVLTGSYRNNKNDKHSKAKRRVDVQASWCSLNSSRQTAPHIKKGMSVLVLKFGNTDRYEWLQYGTQNDLLGKDVFLYLFGNSDEEEMLNSKNSHYIKIDPKYENVMQLHIEKCDNVKVGYDIKIDMTGGEFTIKDTENNKLELLSLKGELNTNVSKKVTVKTKEFIVDADTIELNGKEINIKGTKVGIDGNTTISGTSLSIDTLSTFSQPVTMNNMGIILGFGSPIAHGGTIM